ncbi:hypothetical protein ACF07Y_45750 [Streptomyces sp. NPDC016566]|uniref:hypothetical protein n=1 Tax=Streptomyces sp. NPDC016566 TaxID=3364967 RepID=UPI003702AEC5
MTHFAEQAYALEPRVTAVVVLTLRSVRLSEPWERTISSVIHAAGATGAPTRHMVVTLSRPAEDLLLDPELRFEMATGCPGR